MAADARAVSQHAAPGHAGRSWPFVSLAPAYLAVECLQVGYRLRPGHAGRLAICSLCRPRSWSAFKLAMDCVPWPRRPALAIRSRPLTRTPAMTVMSEPLLGPAVPWRCPRCSGCSSCWWSRRDHLAVRQHASNADRQNIPTSFDFLGTTRPRSRPPATTSAEGAGEDLFVQGFLNTLRVSVAGIVLATVLGTIIGIGRLQRNWLVRILSTAYVEAVRNVPLPLFVIFGVLAVVLGIFPPSRRRGSRSAGGHLQPRRRRAVVRRFGAPVAARSSRWP